MFLFMTTYKKTTVLPLMFLFKTTNEKTTVLPPMFYLIKNDRVTPYVFSMLTNKKPTVVPRSTFLRGSKPELFRVLTCELINAPSRHH